VGCQGFDCGSNVSDDQNACSFSRNVNNDSNTLDAINVRNIVIVLFLFLCVKKGSR
jgi:hypothetical protein